MRADSLSPRERAGVRARASPANTTLAFPKNSKLAFANCARMPQKRNNLCGKYYAIAASTMPNSTANIRSPVLFLTSIVTKPNSVSNSMVTNTPKASRFDTMKSAPKFFANNMTFKSFAFGIAMF